MVLRLVPEASTATVTLEHVRDHIWRQHLAGSPGDSCNAWGIRKLLQSGAVTMVTVSWPGILTWPFPKLPLYSKVIMGCLCPGH